VLPSGAGDPRGTSKCGAPKEEIGRRAGDSFARLAEGEISSKGITDARRMADVPRRAAMAEYAEGWTARVKRMVPPTRRDGRPRPGYADAF